MQAQPQSNLAARIPALAASPLSTIPSLPSPPTPSVADNSGLAHDAGNLLAALGLYSELLHAPGVLRAEHQHYAIELRLIADRSSQLIRRLLTTPSSAAQITATADDGAPLLPVQLFRRPNQRASDILPSSPNHATMLLALAPVLERIAGGAANVVVSCPTPLPPRDFPSEIIERITVNLVRNAAEAIRIQHARAAASPTPSPSTPGQIRVTLAVVTNALQLTVEDNGPGMSPSQVEDYLQPRPLPAGARHGLGHRIVHELVKASDGKLSIRVKQDHGTTFCLQWPISHSSAASCAFDASTSPPTV